MLGLHSFEDVSLDDSDLLPVVEDLDIVDFDLALKLKKDLLCALSSLKQLTLRRSICCLSASSSRKASVVWILAAEEVRPFRPLDPRRRSSESATPRD